MKVVNTIVMGNGPASHYIGFCERRTEVLVLMLRVKHIPIPRLVSG